MSAPIVLIADDDQSDVDFLRQALLEALPGIRVEDVCDGQQTVDYLSGSGEYRDRSRHPFPTHVVLDIKMPRLTGFEVLEWIRSRADLGPLAIVVLSGSQLAGDRGRAHALGAEYFVKPVSYKALSPIARHICRMSASPEVR